MSGASRCGCPAAPEADVAASRGARPRRPGAPPRHRDPARGHGVPRTGPGVPARRARWLVGKRGQTALARRSVLASLRRRWRVRVRHPSRGGTLRHRAGAPAGARRPGPVGGHDTAPPVPSAPPGRANALRVSGGRVALGHGPSGASAPHTPDRTAATPALAPTRPRVGQGEPPPAVARPGPAAHRQPPRVCPLLWRPWERRPPPRGLPQSPTDGVAGAPSAQPTPP